MKTPDIRAWFNTKLTYILTKSFIYHICIYITHIEHMTCYIRRREKTNFTQQKAPVAMLSHGYCVHNTGHVRLFTRNDLVMKTRRETVIRCISSYQSALYSLGGSSYLTVTFIMLHKTKWGSAISRQSNTQFTPSINISLDMD